MILPGGNASSVISLSFIERKHLFTKSSLEKAITDLVDLIKVRLGRDSAEAVSEGLRQTIFDLRIDVFEWLSDHQKTFPEYEEALNQIIVDCLACQPFNELNASLAEVLAAYSSITEPLRRLFPNQFDEVLEVMDDTKPTYGLVKAMALLPIPDFQAFSKFIDASLHLEFGFIASDLILAGELKLTDKKIAELIGFLYANITRFGAYAIHLGLWYPSEEEDLDLFNKMDILAATFELDQKKGTRLPLNDLSVLLSE